MVLNSYPIYLQYSWIHYFDTGYSVSSQGIVSPPPLSRWLFALLGQSLLWSDVGFDEGMCVCEQRGCNGEFRSSVLGFQSTAVLTNVQKKLIVLYFPFFEFLGRQVRFLEQGVDHGQISFLGLFKKRTFQMQK